MRRKFGGDLMVDIPLISGLWKDKRKQEQDESQELIAMGMQEGYEQATMDQREEDIYVNAPPSTENDKDFWRGVFNPTDVDNSGIANKVLPMLATSNYPLQITLEREIYPMKNRVIYLKIEIAYTWVKRWNEWRKAGMVSETDKENPFLGYLGLLISKLDVDARTRLSIGMEGLKEVQTKRGYIERGAKGEGKKLDEKIGVRA
jgi:hypothetical protein